MFLKKVNVLLWNSFRTMSYFVRNISTQFLQERVINTSFTNMLTPLGLKDRTPVSTANYLELQLKLGFSTLHC